MATFGSPFSGSINNSDPASLFGSMSGGGMMPFMAGLGFQRFTDSLKKLQDLSANAPQPFSLAPAGGKSGPAQPAPFPAAPAIKPPSLASGLTSINQAMKMAQLGPGASGAPASAMTTPAEAALPAENAAAGAGLAPTALPAAAGAPTIAATAAPAAAAAAPAAAAAAPAAAGAGAAGASGGSSLLALLAGLL